MDLDTHHLRLVRAIGETGSLSKAAVLLGISQPAVSTKLKRLENMLGQRLFDRCQTGSVIPTPIGELLLRRVLAVLPLMEDLLHDIERHPTAPAGQLRLGSVSVPVIERLLDVLAASRPGAAVSMITDESGDLLLAMVAQERLEIAVVKEYPGFELVVPSEVSTEVIASDPTMVVLRRGHPLADQPTIDLADLRDESWVLPPPSDSRFDEYFRTACRSLDFEPNVVHRASSCAATAMAVRSGSVGMSQGVCEMSAGLVHRPMRTPLIRRFILAWRTDGPLAMDATALADAAKQAYAARLTAALASYTCT